MCVAEGAGIRRRKLPPTPVSGPQEVDVRFSDAVVGEVFCNYGLCANKQCIEQRSDYS
jgi:hypothetical protein